MGGEGGRRGGWVERRSDREDEEVEIWWRTTDIAGRKEVFEGGGVGDEKEGGTACEGEAVSEEEREGDASRSVFVVASRRETCRTRWVGKG